MSLLALQLAASAALGRAWLHRPVAEGVALYVSAEDDVDELHRRLASIAEAEEVEIGDLADLTLLSLAGRDAVLARPDPRTNSIRPTRLFAEIEARIAEERPALVVMDTLSDLSAVDENNRAQARAFVQLLRGIALRHDCAVLLLAHPSLTGMANGSGLSGSTAWSNSVRSRLLLERVTVDRVEADPNARRLVTKKANYAAAGGEIALRWQGGVFVAEGGETDLDRSSAASRAERVFLALLRIHMEQGRFVSASPGPTYAPSIFAKHPDAEGCTRRALASAMEVLLQRGALRVGTHGRGAKARSHIEETPADG